MLSCSVAGKVISPDFGLVNATSSRPTILCNWWHFEFFWPLRLVLPAHAVRSISLNYRPSHPESGQFFEEKMANDPQMLNTSLLRAPN
ncbi:hypothetical protein T01_16016 [Trichinella spiralis]|uniref:Uncharacterized protein n=1 Tax=Trichinella spiralis TaxID=6334 RepID=A0A0V1BGA3_TRISP|nr:hypothetical protein T01_16016 [Trichinella spiralis]